MRIAHYVEDIKKELKSYPALKDLFADRFTVPHPNFPLRFTSGPNYPTPLPIEDFFDQPLDFATVLEQAPSLQGHVPDVGRKRSDDPRDILGSDSLVFGLIAERRQWSGGGIYLLVMQLYVLGAILLGLGLVSSILSAYYWYRFSKRSFLDPALSQRPLSPRVNSNLQLLNVSST